MKDICRKRNREYDLRSEAGAGICDRCRICGMPEGHSNHVPLAAGNGQVLPHHFFRPKGEMLCCETTHVGTMIWRDSYVRTLQTRCAAQDDLISCMRNVLKNILNDLPVKRDWLDPVTEKIAREYAEPS